MKGMGQFWPKICIHYMCLALSMRSFIIHEQFAVHNFEDDDDDGQKLIITTRMNGSYACKLQRACIYFCVSIFHFMQWLSMESVNMACLLPHYHSLWIQYPLSVHSIYFMDCFWCQASNTATKLRYCETSTHFQNWMREKCGDHQIRKNERMSEVYVVLYGVCRAHNSFSNLKNITAICLENIKTINVYNHIGKNTKVSINW